MTSRGKSGVLETAILGLLDAKPMHGYELRKHLNGMLGSFRALSYGSLYPCLKSLVARRWIRETDQLAAPEHALSGKRARITYEVTPFGKAKLAEILASSGPSTWEDEQFGVRFALFAQTDPETRIRILEGRRTRLSERLEALAQSGARTRSKLDSYTLELQRYGLEQVEREVAWLDGLLDDERRSRFEGHQTRSQPAASRRPSASGGPDATAHTTGSSKAATADGSADSSPTQKKERG